MYSYSIFLFCFIYCSILFLSYWAQGPFNLDSNRGSIFEPGAHWPFFLWPIYGPILTHFGRPIAHKEVGQRLGKWSPNLAYLLFSPASPVSPTNMVPYVLLQATCTRSRPASKLTRPFQHLQPQPTRRSPTVHDPCTEPSLLLLEPPYRLSSSQLPCTAEASSPALPWAHALSGLSQPRKYQLVFALPATHFGFAKRLATGRLLFLYQLLVFLSIS